MTRIRERGVALVLVLWVSVLLAVVAASFIVERRSDFLIVHNSVSIARAQAAADAGVQRALLDAFRADQSPQTWKRDGTSHEWSFDGVPIRVEMRDESGKIDINSASDELLRGLLVSVGLAPDDASRLLDAILDWRDLDSMTRPNGAEEADYRSAGLTYRPANGPFQTIEELQLVLGMRPEIYRRIAPMITVYSRQPGVNTTLASREVLLAIPGVSADAVDAYLAQREQARVDGLPLPVFQQGAAFNSPGSLLTNVRAEAKLDDGTFFAREAVALVRATPRRPVTFVVWREAAATPESKDALAAGAAPNAAAPAAGGQR
jgi:general secretion pathway protein K